MPELTDRGAYEEALAKELAEAMGIQYEEAIELLGYPPDVNRLTESHWEKHRGKLIAILSLGLMNVFTEAAVGMSRGLSYELDPADVQAQAAEWAGRYAGELVSGIEATTRNRLARLISTAVENEWQIERITEALTPLYGPVRAEMIAVTEVTRAITEGELAIIRDLERQGIRMLARWQTQEDERVCPICSPRNEQLQGEGWYDTPPAHPRCRCWITYELEK